MKFTPNRLAFLAAMLVLGVGCQTSSAQMTNIINSTYVFAGPVTFSNGTTFVGTNTFVYPSVFLGALSGPTPSATSNLANKAYVDGFRPTVTNTITFSTLPTNAGPWSIWWWGPWPQTRTLVSFSAQTYASTCGVRIIEKRTNQMWNEIASTNVFLNAGTNNPELTAFDDSTVGVNTMMGVQFTDNTGSNITIKIGQQYVQ